MKTITFLLLMIPSTFQAPKIYSKYGMLGSTIDDSHSIEFYSNNEYKFEYRTSSCWNWRDYYGVWEIKNNRLKLIETVSLSEEFFSYDFQSYPNISDKVLVRVLDQENQPVSKMKFSHTVSNENEWREYITDINGEFFIEKPQTENEYLLSGSFVEESITFSSVLLSIKLTSTSGLINIEFNRNPLTRQEVAIQEFEIEDEQLVLVEKDENGIGRYIGKGATFIRKKSTRKIRCR